MRYIFLTGLLLWGILPGRGLKAQETLTLEDAVQEALQNNYGIKLARFDVEQRENQAYIGATGALPSVNLSGGSNLGYTRQFTGTPNAANSPDTLPPRELTGRDILTYGFNAALGVNYTLSLGDYTNFQVLSTNVNQSQENLYLTLEQTIAQVSNAFYALARLEDSYDLQKESLDLSKERLASVRNRAEFGQANGVAVLNAQVDVNSDSLSLAETEANLDNARRDLNYLIGREVESPFDVDTDIEPMALLSQLEMQNSALSQNSSLVIADYERKIANLNLKSARQRAYPTLSISGAYSYQFSDNGPVGFLIQQNSDGLNLSGTLSIPIFNGNQVRRNIQNAEIGIASSQTNYKQVEQRVIRDVNKAYASYLNAREFLSLSQKNLEAAKANFNRTQEAFELGQATNVQFRDAQINLLRVKFQLREFLYRVKNTEVELLRLSGQLVEKK